MKTKRWRVPCMVQLLVGLFKKDTNLCLKCKYLSEDGICYELSNRVCCACRPDHRNKCKDFKKK